MTARLSDLSPPTPLGPDHDTAGFDCGIAPLDDWLKRRARNNELSGASRTFVLTSAARVVGYYALAAGSVLSEAATGQVRRNMPSPVPIVLLGRLAIDRARQGRGLGADLLRDAGLRTLAAADVIGARALFVHAILADARAFYERHGFQPSPVDPMTLMVLLQDLRRAYRHSTAPP